ncbi:bifunctional [glutamine synthetase] adenylyltransferase/[glutamine synthetase]-adenylyl-L-tyrosine phosphorylase [Agrococcus versicolor]|uniref:Bifunctional [glutamine synthetase] adenylyltransferase/[glutamine synthetase]-adenylyl-L-tyrosine phosphorylase n=1 Tax=Agrococcus versicolor TaxID=501482 RepID=A0ABN3AQN2_9MICO
MRAETTTSRLARLGFSSPSEAIDLVGEVESVLGERLDDLRLAADPDRALRSLVRLHRAGLDLAPTLADAAASASLMRVLGASTGLATCIERAPELLEALVPRALPTTEELRSSLQEAVADPEASRTDAIVAMRRRYRRHLTEIVAYDLAQPDPVAHVQAVSAALADAAASALEASLTIARRTVAVRFGADDVAATALAVIGMGKTGARELNVLSDVDVIWVHGSTEAISEERAAQVAQALARETTAGCVESAREPMLWEVDANLRPEGKDGTLTRTLESHVAYYERWAKSWEFQALLKARAVAGDAELGAAYEEAVASRAWQSSSRGGFVESVQRMRERVTAHIPADEVDWQLKLGPGGLRDVEFTVQLLQLVHGATDEHVRQRGTLEAIDALLAAGMIGRVEAGEFADDYRQLRVLEHRAQLARLSRTHLMPSDPDAQRGIARAAGFADAEAMLARWTTIKREVRRLHERLFYRPLLAAVASLPDGSTQLTDEAARARLEASGFRDPKGALAQIGALTNGVTRRAQIQRVLLPVLLQWLSEGPDPDMGLLAFRRLSEALGESPWYLRMLRDSELAAQRLMTVLSSSRLIATLLERIPEAAHWLADESRLQALPHATLADEARAIVERHRDDRATAQTALRTLRRRELLRAALASALAVDDVLETGERLTGIAGVTIDAALDLAGGDVAIGVVSMGRTGGREIGFGSDVDVLWVCRDESDVDAAMRAVRAASEIVQDPSVKFELDAGLRPEGRQGPLVRTLASYATYYERWGEVWEQQALLRAAPFAGDRTLADDLLAIVVAARDRDTLSQTGAREIRRIKARVEAERLPQNADRTRHLKLGRGSLSDVEWLVQLLQLQQPVDGARERHPTTLVALAGLVEAGAIPARDAAILRRAWLLASRLRNALALAQARTIDLLPTDRGQLEVVARLMGRTQGSAATVEEEYLRATRLARKVFDERFWG